MAIQELYASSSSGSTIGTTEYSLTHDSTTLQSRTTDAQIQVVVDTVNLAAGDSFELRLLEKVVSGATQREVFRSAVQYGQGIVMTGFFTLLHGWDVTLKKLTGTDRAIIWSIRGNA